MCTHNRYHDIEDDGVLNNSHLTRRVNRNEVVREYRIQPDKKVVEKSEYCHPDLVQHIACVVHPTPHDIVYDLGCGDGRILIAMAKYFKCRCVGIEIDQQRVLAAKKNVVDAGLEGLITIVHGDMFTDGYVETATIIVAWQFDDAMLKLRPRIDGAERLRCLVTIEHKLPWTWAVPEIRHINKQGEFYVRRK